jgi:hypothetical protein
MHARHAGHRRVPSLSIRTLAQSFFMFLRVPMFLRVTESLVITDVLQSERV